jgi:glutamate dehydrogenase/leucine dehydrogenase
MNQEQKQEPTVITLDNTNSVQILNQYVELAQQKGAYALQEAELLKRASDVLLNSAQDQEINSTNARQLLIQGVHKGQRHGAYTLNDAALLSKVVQFVTSNVDAPVQSVQPSAPSNTDDLSDLAEPIPLKPKEV